MKHLDYSHTPILQSLMSRMRSVGTSSAEFNFLSEKFNSVMATEVVNQLPMKNELYPVTTPLMETTGFRFKDNVVVIPILRAGLSMLDPFRSILSLMMGENPETGFMAMSRDEKTAESTCHYSKIPSLKGKTVLVLDPMLATGGSAHQALEYVFKQNPRLVAMVSVLAAPEGIKFLGNQDYSNDLHLYTGVTDTRLNESHFIEPGLGDFGDRFYNA